MSNSSKYNVLMFGNLGPELLKLSSIFDPDNDEFAYQSEPAAIAGREYYTAELKNNTLRFFKLETQPAVGTELPTNSRWWCKTNSAYNQSETGKYVPEPTSIVVVDSAVGDTGYGKWETYTVLVVESVDPITFKSTMVPANFAGTLDSYQRAIDFQNDKMMLYVDQLDSNKFRLVPDRKLLLYGSTPLYYVIKSNDVVISTNKFNESGTDDTAAYSHYVSAVSKQVTVTEETKSEILGRYAEYIDATTGSRVRCIIDESKANAIAAGGVALNDVVYVLKDSDSVLNGLQVPQPCYLMRNAGVTVAEGDKLTFEAYEERNVDNGAGGTVAVKRLIMTVQLTATAGTSSSLIDSSAAMIAGFGVKYRTNTTGPDTYENGDVFTVVKGTGKDEIISRIVPFLYKSDGSTEVISASQLNALWFIHGLEDYDPSMPAGYGFELLIRYFPPRNTEVPTSLNTLDHRYEQLSPTAIAVGPSPLRQYFIKSGDEFSVAGTNGGYLDAFEFVKLTAEEIAAGPVGGKKYFTKSGDTYNPVNLVADLTTFVEGTDYYLAKYDYHQRRIDLGWGHSVHTPARDFVNCHKMIRIEAKATNSLIHPVLVPQWETWLGDSSQLSFRFGMMLYDQNYASPEVVPMTDLRIAALSYVSGDDNGLASVLDGRTTSGGGPVAEIGSDLAYRQKFNFKYRQDTVTEFDTVHHEIGVRLRSPAKLDSGARKWVIDIDGNTYGSTASALPDPHIIYDHGNNVYRFNSSVFTSKDVFLRTFYYSAFGNDAIEPTHIQLRGLNPSDRATAASETYLIPLDDPSGSEQALPFLVDFTRVGGMMPTRFEKSIRTIIVADGSNNWTVPPNGAICGVVILEFVVVNGAEERVVGGVPVEVRVTNFDLSKDPNKTPPDVVAS